MYLLYAVAGACLASFSVCIAQDWVNGTFDSMRRSRCDFCSHTLSWYDLIPIISFLSLRGHCRYCNLPIHRLTFWGEVLGIIYMLVVRIHFGVDLWVVWVFFELCVLIMTFTDILAYWVPDFLIGVLILITGYFSIFHHLTEGFLAVALWVAMLLLLLWWFRPNWFGGADVKLLVIMAYWLSPFDFALFLFISSMSALIYCWLSCQRLNISARSLRIPFVPFIVFGFHLTLLLR